MPALTDQERAQLKRFDPDNMPAFARFISGPEDTADIFDSTSERRLWLYRPDWESLGLTGFFDRKATLPGHETYEEALVTFSRLDGICHQEKISEEMHEIREKACHIINSPHTSVFLDHCQSIALDFMQNMKAITRTELIIRFDFNHTDSDLHVDPEALIGAMATEWGGTLVPDPASMKKQGLLSDLNKVYKIQDLLAKNVDVYAIDIGDWGLMRGKSLQRLAQFKKRQKFATMHAVNPTPPGRAYTRPFVGMLMDIPKSR